MPFNSVRTRSSSRRVSQHSPLHSERAQQLTLTTTQKPRPSQHVYRHRMFTNDTQIQRTSTTSSASTQNLLSERAINIAARKTAVEIYTKLSLSVWRKITAWLEMLMRSVYFRTSRSVITSFSHGRLSQQTTIWFSVEYPRVELYSVSQTTSNKSKTYRHFMLRTQTSLNANSTMTAASTRKPSCHMCLRREPE